jgi:hypothetical protein
MHKKIIISVISDLVTDQRVQKVATTLQNNGFEVTVIGAKKSSSKPLPTYPYTAKRIRMMFNNGFLFYAEWNIRLFIKLFFIKKNILVANDLDTLLPNFLQSKVFGNKLVYDSHEYFTEQEELQHRPLVKKVWLKLEKWIFPKLKNVYTVNKSIAAVYQNEYHVNVGVIKNLPQHKLEEIPTNDVVTLITKQLADKKIIITQGTGFNANRGVEELINAMDLIDDCYCLLIIGNGLIIDKLKQMAKNKTNIYFLDTVNPAQLKWITKHAYIGCSLDKPTCLNYEYALPNKLFDFIHAYVPVIVSNRVEVANIVNQNIGIILDVVTPNSIATAITSINNETYEIWKKQLINIAPIYTWENQESDLVKIYNKIK